MQPKAFLYKNVFQDQISTPTLYPRSQPRPRPAFRRLQYGNFVRARGDSGNEAGNALHAMCVVSTATLTI